MAEAGDRALRHWLRNRGPEWQQMEELLADARRNLDPAQADGLVRHYRDLARDVSLARRVLPASPVTRHLEALYREAHEAIHREPPAWRERLVKLYRDEVPAAIRAVRMPLLVITLLFFASALSGAWLVHRYPELAALFASEEMINGVQRGQLWTDNLLNIVPSSVLSVAIMGNNIIVALTAFVLGAFYGLGTLYIVTLNGAMLGAVFAFTYRHGMADELLSFILAHGIAELSVIGIAGAAGVLLGEALARPGNRSRSEAFRLAVADSGRLMAVCVPALVLCGVIEGYVSPDPAYGFTQRLVIGLGLFVLLCAALRGSFWRRPAA